MKNMQRKIKVSAIIPVFNSEEYLEQCIDSLIKQTLEEIEFIFVNDGSTDNSKKIIEKYGREDSRVIIINQENKGPSCARNVGINIARGEYLAFIDSDDMIDKNMFFELYNKVNLNNCDIAICDMNIINNKNFYKKSVDLKSYVTLCEKNEIFKILLCTDSLNSLGNKIYSNNIIKTNQIRLDKNFDYGEDLLFNLEFFKYCNKYIYINEPFYYYRKGHLSLTSKYDSTIFERNGINLYKVRKKYGEELLKDSFLGAKKLFETSSYCLINEFRKINEINLKIKKNNAIKIMNNLELIEAMENLNSKNLSLKERILYFSIKNKSIIVFRLIAFIIDNKYKL